MTITNPQTHCDFILTDVYGLLVSDCCLTPTTFQPYHGENKLIFNEKMMRSAFYYTNTLSWNFTVLVHWNNSPLIDMSLHSDTLSWFRPNQCLLSLSLLNATCLAEKQQIQFYSLWFDPVGARTHDLPHPRRVR